MVVAAYLRISKDPYGVAAGVERQRKDTHRIAAERWPGEAVTDYVDNDVSAWSGKRRPEWERMLADAARGELTAIVVYDVDRLARQPQDLERLITIIQNHHVAFATAQGTINLTTGDGRAMARVLVTMATKASDDASRRMKRVKADRRERGQKVGGPDPYGYSGIDRQPVPDQLLRLETAARRLLEGESVSVVHRWFSEDAAAPQTRQGLRQALLRGGYGSPTLCADVRALLTTDGRRRGITDRRTQWLSGILVCRTCLKGLYSQGGRKRYWGCIRGCSSISGEVVHYVMARAFAIGDVRVHEPERTLIDTGPDPAVQERLDLLAAEYTAGNLTDSEWRAARKAAMPAPAPMPAPPSPRPVEALRERWGGMTVQQRHDAVRALWSRIVVGAPRYTGRPKFDPARLEFHKAEGVEFGSVEVVTDDLRRHAIEYVLDLDAEVGGHRPGSPKTHAQMTAAQERLMKRRGVTLLADDEID